MTYHKLLNNNLQTGQGCIFYPALPCSDKQIKKKNKKKTLSKIILNKNLLKYEYSMNLLIQQIPNYSDWTNIWFNKCKSPQYKYIRHNSDIDKCLSLNHINLNQIPSNYSFNMLQGTYGGISSNEFMINNFNHNVYNNNKLFIQQFIYLFHTLEPLFLGLKQLYKYKICHHDLAIHNILFQNDKFIIIDYGLSFQFKNINMAIRRINEEIHTNRLYESYPFEYLYYNINPRMAKRELQNYSSRKIYKYIYEFIHQKLFYRNIPLLIENLLKSYIHYHNPSNLSLLIQSLDIYSLGMIPFILLIDHSDTLKISPSKFPL